MIYYFKPFILSIFALSLVEYNAIMGSIAVTFSVFFAGMKLINEYKNKKKGKSSNKFPEL